MTAADIGTRTNAAGPSQGHLKAAANFAQRIVRSPQFKLQAATVALRGAGAAGKFALSLYLLAYAGLADLGVYGLLVAAATIGPAVLGFGLTDWTARECVGLERRKAISIGGTRLCFTLVVHLVVQPPAWALNAWLGYPIAPDFVLPIALILLLEQIGAEAQALLIARERVMLSNFVLFLRSGAWPIAIIALGLVYPDARSLLWVLIAWVGGMIATALVLFGFALQHSRAALFRPNVRWLGTGLARSWPFYLSDMGAVSSLYLDRFLISLFVGLETTGIYVFFWSAANVVHSLTVYGTFSPRVPGLIAAANARDFTSLRSRFRQFRRSTLVWALALFVSLWIAIQALLALGLRPQLSGHGVLFCMIMLATVLRILADMQHFVLYALSRDRSIGMINASSAIGTAALTALLVWLAGVAGAVAATILSAAAVLFTRRELSRF